MARTCISDANNCASTFAGLGSVHILPITITDVGGTARNLIASTTAACNEQGFTGWVCQLLAVCLLQQDQVVELEAILLIKALATLKARRHAPPAELAHISPL